MPELIGFSPMGMVERFRNLMNTFSGVGAGGGAIFYRLRENELQKRWYQDCRTALTFHWDSTH